MISCRMNAIQTVVDGDTLIIGRKKIRFNNIDAPETNQICTCQGKQVKCGVQAKNVLLDLIGTKTVSCEPSGRDIYGRLLAECFIPVNGEKTSLNTLMVQTGMAFVISKRDEALLTEESNAINQKKGIWGCERFQMPSDFRKSGQRERSF